MEIYTLNKDTFLAEFILESYSSFIWTERYSAMSDFRIELKPTFELQRDLTPGTFIGFDLSDVTMRVGSISIERNDEGKRIMVVEGESIDWIMTKRYSQNYTDPGNPTPITGLPSAIIRNIMLETFNNPGSGRSGSKIGSYFDVIVTGITGETSTTVIVKTENLYSAIKKLADTFGYGFKLTIPNPGFTNFRFRIYKGLDKTATVVFSPDVETLSDTRRFISDEEYYSRVYVFNDEFSTTIINRNEVLAQGFDYRELIVDASDIQGGVLDAMAPLQARAKEALEQTGKVDILDGKVNPQGSYEYRRDYNLGDLVTMSEDGTGNRPMMVTEHIYSYDETGLKSFPTLISPKDL